MKHIYFITCYKNFVLLNKLIYQLDYDNNLILLHIDSKVSDFNFDSFKYDLNLKHADIIDMPRHDMVWASYAEIACILDAMQVALNYDWDYFHYITENDMPLKPQNWMHDFFEKNAGKEFISYTPQWYDFGNYKCQVYHLTIDNPKYRKNKMLHYINHGLAKIQYALGVRRSKQKFYHGSGYFSVTRDFVKYVLSKKTEIEKTYSKTLCGLEVFMQTLCIYSPYRKNIYKFESKFDGNLRYIDWDRRDGNSPYTFSCKDWDDIKDKMDNTDICFVRKITTDYELVGKIEDHLREMEQKNNE